MVSHEKGTYMLLLDKYAEMTSAKAQAPTCERTCIHFSFFIQSRATLIRLPSNISASDKKGLPE